MITLIGARCKASDCLSRGVLISHSQPAIERIENSHFLILPRLAGFILPFETKIEPHVLVLCREGHT